MEIQVSSTLTDQKTNEIFIKNEHFIYFSLTRSMYHRLLITLSSIYFQSNNYTNSIPCTCKLCENTHCSSNRGKQQILMRFIPKFNTEHSSGKGTSFLSQPQLSSIDICWRHYTLKQWFIMGWG